jgi:arylsulfatase A-like enzyme
MIGALDESVGAVVGGLRTHHRETNTLVIFCSDNGPAAPRGVDANGGLQGQKGSLFEGGHRVPCIARWPGVIPPGTTNSRTMMTMDLLPTFAKLAGASIPEGHALDGADIMPLLRGETNRLERVLHWKHGEAWAVRRGPWKVLGDGDRSVALVNVVEDIGERTNLLPAQPATAAGLRSLHLQWIQSVGTK